jgi:hypothetical protein
VLKMLAVITFATRIGPAVWSTRCWIAGQWLRKFPATMLVFAGIILHFEYGGLVICLAPNTLVLTKLFLVDIVFEKLLSSIDASAA